MQKPGDLLAVDVQHQAVLVDVDVDAANSNFPEPSFSRPDLSPSPLWARCQESLAALGQALFRQVTLSSPGNQ